MVGVNPGDGFVIKAKSKHSMGHWGVGVCEEEGKTVHLPSLILPSSSLWEAISTHWSYRQFYFTSPWCRQMAGDKGWEGTENTRVQTESQGIK